MYVCVYIYIFQPNVFALSRWGNTEGNEKYQWILQQFFVVLSQRSALNACGIVDNSLPANLCLQSDHLLKPTHSLVNRLTQIRSSNWLWPAAYMSRQRGVLSQQAVSSAWNQPSKFRAKLLALLQQLQLTKFVFDAKRHLRIITH